MHGEVLSSVKIGESVIYQELGEEAVVLNMASQEYYGLDDVGATMWKCLLQHGTFEGALQALESVYAVDREILSDDLRAMIQSLKDANLLKVSELTTDCSSGGVK